MEKTAQSQTLANAPLEARILVVADVYDSLTSALNERISPSEAMERIAQRAGIEYDADVVDAMVKVFRKRAAMRARREDNTNRRRGRGAS